MYTIINYSLHSEPDCFNVLNINETWFWDIKSFYSILILVSLILLSRACNNEDLSLKEAALNNTRLREVGQSWLQALYSKTSLGLEWSPVTSGLLWASAGIARHVEMAQCRCCSWNSLPEFCRSFETLSAATVNHDANSSAAGFLLKSLYVIIGIGPGRVFCMLFTGDGFCLSCSVYYQ